MAQVVRQQGSRKLFCRTIGTKEVYWVEVDGKKWMQKLTVDRKNQSGSFEAKSTYDSFSGGGAVATHAHGDDVLAASMAFDEWVEKYMQWFDNVLADG